MWMKKFRDVIQWVLIVAFFPVILSFVSIGKSRIVCTDVHVEVTDSLNSGFVSPEQIKAALLKKYPEVLGNAVEGINCEEIELFLKKHQAIKECEAFCTVNGVLNVFIGQRKPLLRVFSGYDSYYIDEDGNKMPLFDQFSAQVLVLSGHVNLLDSLNEVVSFAHFVENDPFWSAQIEQIYVEKNGEYSLAPRVGDQIIYLGSLDRFQEKMRNLYALYTQGLDPREWNNYKEISLKFEGQIICTKR